jgi:GNAT superfamily N-acetyltransferase
MTVVVRFASPSEAQDIESRLQAFNASHIGHHTAQPLKLVAYEHGHLIGGLLGQTCLEWLQVDMLWVKEERRGLGVGRSLLAAAEAQARDRHCHDAFLDTFDWQAEPFYRRQGYESFAQLEDCPSRGHIRTYMRKSLISVHEDPSNLGPRHNRTY